jgi:hypothetical protein
MKRTVALVMLTLALLGACGGDDDDAGGSEPPATEPTEETEATEEQLPQGTIVATEGVVVTEGLSNDHTRSQVEYETRPPVGGEHYPGWQACGYYTVPIEDERAVHSMEHGAIWIAYGPGADLGSLPDQADNGDYLLLSPYANLPSPLVASAWGAQLQVQTPDDPALADFVQTYQGIGLEPGAPCKSNGQGAPPTDAGGPLD